MNMMRSGSDQHGDGDDDDDIEDNRIEMKGGDNFLSIDEVNG